MEAVSGCAASFWKGLAGGAALTLLTVFVLLSVGALVAREWTLRRKS